MDQGFLKLALVTPAITPGSIRRNTEGLISQVKRAYEAGARVLVAPELAITGASCQDLFLDEGFLGEARHHLDVLASSTSSLDALIVCGVPVAVGPHAFDCAAVMARGKILGLVPKVHLGSEELRWFDGWNPQLALPDTADAALLCGPDTVFQVFDERRKRSFSLKVCLGDDLEFMAGQGVEALRGASLICHLDARPFIPATAAGQQARLLSLSATTPCAIAHVEACKGESTEDVVYATGKLAVQAGSLIAATASLDVRPLEALVDTQLVAAAQKRAARQLRNPGGRQPEGICTVGGLVGEGFWSDLDLDQDRSLMAPDQLNPTPFLPGTLDRDRFCEDVLSAQAQALARRMQAVGTNKVVLGLSGGLDSTLALMVCVRAFRQLDLDLKGILAVSMPGFGTTSRTFGNARRLAEGYQVSCREISIKRAVEGHFQDIDYDPEARDVVFENAQARERTQILMDVANQQGCFVVGTGDLSEVALGWSTYSGDHMSMYGVNASVPKTLVRQLVAHEARRLQQEHPGSELAEALLDVVNTPVSPELLPPDEAGRLVQRTESQVGPYVLHDFFLYHMMVHGFGPARIFALARLVFSPVWRSYEETYSEQDILQWMKVFYQRFFSQQFKRSCMPAGPQVTPVSLSPRAGLFMPSDLSGERWIREVDTLLDKI